MTNADSFSRSSGMGRAFRHRNYRLFFGGQLVSLTGTWVQNLAQAWLVYRLTGSAEMLGLIVLAQHGPVFLLANFGGVLADRVDRHRILLVTQCAAMVSAAALAVLTLTETIQVWEVFALSALLGTANAFDIPARQSFIVEMVGLEDLPNAIAINSSMFNAARLVGPAVGGILVATVGEAWCFTLNAASYVFVLAALLAMRREKVDRTAKRRRVLVEMVEGLSFVRRHRPIRSILLLLAVSSLTGISLTTLMPIFADQVLGGGASVLGTLMSAVGMGALAGALLLVSRSNSIGLDNWIFGGSLGYGIALALFSLSSLYWLSAALAAMAGFCQIVQLASSNTLIQSLVSEQFRGRTMAVYSTVFMGMAPFGGMLAGHWAERIGAPQTVLLCGIICATGGIVFRIYSPGMRTWIVEQATTPEADRKTPSRL